MSDGAAGSMRVREVAVSGGLAMRRELSASLALISPVQL